MTRYDRLMARLGRGDRILMDGATGTELERRGVPQLENAWDGGAAFSHPEVLRGIHEDYIQLGAEVVISNTFATSRHALADAGVGEQFDAYNARGVALACEARDRAGRPDVLVAGGISYWSWTGAHPTLAQLERDVATQAGVMAQTGADLLVLEMMIDMDRMLATLSGARRAGLPVWVGLTCEPDAGGTMCLRNGAPLAEALAELAALDVPLVNIMHTEVEHIDGCLDVLQGHWSALVGVYAHTGHHVDGVWRFDDTISPADYANNARRWLGRDVRAIGGCCGIRPEHIAEVAKLV